jgi:hypothetical protein
MTELVTDQMVQVANRALAWNECKDNLPNGKCDCPSQEEIRRILSVAAPLIAARALEKVADELSGHNIFAAGRQYGKTVRMFVIWLRDRAKEF